DGSAALFVRRSRGAFQHFALDMAILGFAPPNQNSETRSAPHDSSNRSRSGLFEGHRLSEGRIEKWRSRLTTPQARNSKQLCRSANSSESRLCCKCWAVSMIRRFGDWSGGMRFLEGFDYLAA